MIVTLFKIKPPKIVNPTCKLFLQVVTVIASTHRGINKPKRITKKSPDMGEFNKKHETLCLLDPSKSDKSPAAAEHRQTEMKDRCSRMPHSHRLPTVNWLPMDFGDDTYFHPVSPAFTRGKPRLPTVHWHPMDYGMSSEDEDIFYPQASPPPRMRMAKAGKF